MTLESLNRGHWRKYKSSYYKLSGPGHWLTAFGATMLIAGNSSAMRDPSATAQTDTLAAGSQTKTTWLTALSSPA